MHSLFVYKTHYMTFFFFFTSRRHGPCTTACITKQIHSNLNYKKQTPNGWSWNMIFYNYLQFLKNSLLTLFSVLKRRPCYCSKWRVVTPCLSGRPATRFLRISAQPTGKRKKNDNKVSVSGWLLVVITVLNALDVGTWRAVSSTGLRQFLKILWRNIGTPFSVLSVDVHALWHFFHERNTNLRSRATLNCPSVKNEWDYVKNVYIDITTGLLYICQTLMLLLLLL